MTLWYDRAAVGYAEENSGGCRSGRGGRRGCGRRRRGRVVPNCGRRRAGSAAPACGPGAQALLLPRTGGGQEAGRPRRGNNRNTFPSIPRASVLSSSHRRDGCDLVIRSHWCPLARHDRTDATPFCSSVGLAIPVLATPATDTTSVHAVDANCKRRGIGAVAAALSGRIRRRPLGGERALLLLARHIHERSARAVAEAAHFYKLGLTDGRGVHDEIDLPPARCG